jgi:hypothetical protein
MVLGHMIQELFPLVPVDAAGRAFIQEGVTFRDPFEIEGEILRFYGALVKEKPIERLKHSLFLNIDNSA